MAYHREDTKGYHGTRNLLCAWHIDRAWRKRLQNHAPDTQAHIELYYRSRTLIALITQLDVAHFQVMF